MLVALFYVKVMTKVAYYVYLTYIRPSSISHLAIYIANVRSALARCQMVRCEILGYASCSLL